MKVIIISIGTLGDVQPSLILGLALLSRDHEVVMVTEEQLRPLIEEMSRGGSAVSPPSPNEDDDNNAPPPYSPPPPPSKLLWRLIEGDKAGVVEQPHVQEMLANGWFLKMMKRSSSDGFPSSGGKVS